MVSLFFGDLMWTRGQKIFGQGITGLGLALLYLSFWAAFGVYHLMPQPAAFLLMVLTTAASVVFAMRYESQVIALIGMLAGYWTPGALSSGEPHPWILFNYVFLLNLGGLALTRLRRWAALEILSAVATILWFGAWLAFSARLQRSPGRDGFRARLLRAILLRASAPAVVRSLSSLGPWRC